MTQAKRAESGITSRIVLMQGDLTEMDTEAIVNAANNDLLLGGGVAGAIDLKGGIEIQKECDAIGTIPLGGAVAMGGGNLRARYVIHAASMELGGRTDAKALRGSTAHSLRIANEKRLKSIAFPAVGTGIAQFPIDQCAEIMLREVVGHLKRGSSLEKVYFVLFDAEALKVFEKVWRRVKEETTHAEAGGGNA